MLTLSFSRYYWCFCMFPFIYLIGIGSVSLSIADILKGSIHGTFFTALFPFLGICSQQIRTTTLLTIVERLVATIFLEKYTRFSQSFYTAVFMSISTYIITGTYIFFVSFCKLAVISKSSASYFFRFSFR